MIAPCGLECSRCVHYLATRNSAARKQVEQWSAILNIPIETITCKGCRAQAGQIPLQQHLFGDAQRCSIYGCAQRKKAEYCGPCDQFPCDIHYQQEIYSKKLLDMIKGMLGNK